MPHEIEQVLHAASCLVKRALHCCAGKRPSTRRRTAHASMATGDRWRACGGASGAFRYQQSPSCMRHAPSHAQLPVLAAALCALEHPVAKPCMCLAPSAPLDSDGSVVSCIPPSAGAAAAWQRAWERISRTRCATPIGAAPAAATSATAPASPASAPRAACLPVASCSMKPSSTATSRCVAAESFNRNDAILLQERRPCSKLAHSCCFAAAAAAEQLHPAGVIEASNQTGSACPFLPAPAAFETPACSRLQSSKYLI